MEVNMIVEASQCRVYDETPEKVGKKRVLEISTEEKKPVFKTILIDDVGGVSLREDELLITHRAIKNDNEKLMVLATTGCSELVLVVEGLLLLQEDFDIEFMSLSGMRQFSTHVEYLLKDVQVEEKPTFSRFCFALFKAATRHITPATPNSKGKSLRVNAQPSEIKMMNAMKDGIALYDVVGEGVMERAEHRDNALSQEICKFSNKNLCAWSDLYLKRRDRHILSHPFKFISHDVRTARRAFDVLVYIVNQGDYHTLTPLLRAALPRISLAIRQQEEEIKQEEAELDAGAELMKEFWARLQA